MDKKKGKRAIRWTRVLVVLELLNESSDLVAKIIDLINHLIKVFF